MKPFKKYIAVCLVASVCFCNLEALAQQAATRASLLSQQVNLTQEVDLVREVNSTRHRADLSPSEKLPFAEAYIAQSKKNNWPLGGLVANVLKIELLKKLEKKTITRTQLNQLKLQAANLDCYECLVRLDVIELHLLSYGDNTADAVTKQLQLFNAAQKIQDIEFAAYVYSEVGKSQVVLLNFQGAVISLQYAHQLYLQDNNLAGLAKVLNVLGSVNITLKNIEPAVKYLTEAIDIANQQGDEFSASVINFNIGEAYFESGDLQQAQKYHQQALELSHKLKDTTGIAYSNAALADIFAAERQWQKALSLYQSSYKVFLANGNFRKQFAILIGEGKSYLALGDYSGAMAALAKIGKIQTTLEDPNNQVKYNELLADALYEKGDYASAFETLKKTLRLSDALHTAEQEKQTARYKVKFESQLIEEKNNALTFQNQLNAHKIQQQEHQAKIWALVFLLAIILLIFTLWLLMTKIKHGNRFKALAFVDSLTSSPNRRDILENGEDYFQRAKETNKIFSVAIVDLDEFKKINDIFGHEIGDNVLKVFAQACKANLRETDKYGRFGGEEWLFVFEHSNMTAIQTTFQRLRDALQQDPIEGLPDGHQVTFSMGVSCFDPSRDTCLQDLITRADKNLYVAKNQGRDQIVY